MLGRVGPLMVPAVGEGIAPSKRSGKDVFDGTPRMANDTEREEKCDLKTHIDFRRVHAAAPLV
jgi:hypothetical protein